MNVAIFWLQQRHLHPNPHCHQRLHHRYFHISSMEAAIRLSSSSPTAPQDKYPMEALPLAARQAPRWFFRYGNSRTCLSVRRPLQIPPTSHSCHLLRPPTVFPTRCSGTFELRDGTFGRLEGFIQSAMILAKFCRYGRKRRHDHL